MIGVKLGPYRFNHWVRRFGFGSLTGVDLPGEDGGHHPAGLQVLGLVDGQPAVRSGRVGDADPDRDRLLGDRQRRDPAPAAHRAVDRRQAGHPPGGHRIISEHTAAELRQMLIGVFGEGGTASGAAIPGYEMAGKTGTANIAINGHYSDSEYVASFVGMVPANHPQLLALVVVDEPQGSIYGGSVAAPAFQKIVGWAVPYLGISPR